MSQFAVILPAAGSSTRFGGNKLRHHLGGLPVIARSALAFVGRGDVSLVIMPTRPQVAEKLPDELHPSLAEHGRKIKLCAGGECRAASVLNALREVPPEIEWVAVHDAARPLVSQRLIDATFAAAVERGAAVPALPVSLTIKQASGPLPAKVQRTVPRRELWAMQTPQVMRRADLLDAFASCPIPLDEVTDDVQLLE